MTTHPTPAPPARHRTTGVLGRLNTEWASMAHSPTAKLGAYTALDGLVTVGDVVAAIAISDRAGADRILRALLESHHDGHTLAGRVLLQTMLGKVARLTRTAYGRGLDAPDAVALEAMWAAITTCPLHRPGSVAGSLALDALKRIPDADHEATPHELDEHVVPAAPTSRPDRRPEALRALAAARSRSIITPAEAELLEAVYLTDTPTLLTEAAFRLGISSAAAWQRHHRALTKLTAAVEAGTLDYAHLTTTAA